MSFRNALAKCRNIELSVSRPIKHMKIDATRFTRRSPKLQLFSKWTCACAVDRLPVYLHPTTHFAQPLNTWGGNQPFRSWTNIQQVVAAFRCDINQVANQYLTCLSFIIVELETPRGIHGHAAFPIHAWKTVCRNLLFRCSEVTGVFLIR